jgi:hypothetical protein
MRNSTLTYRIFTVILWLLALAAIFIWFQKSKVGSDLQVYHRAIQSISTGQDPYLQSMSKLKAYLQDRPVHADEFFPVLYIYPPVTLQALRLAAKFSLAQVDFVFWLLYFIGALAMVLVTMSAAEGKERKWIFPFAPFILFIPGLLVHRVFQVGNVAYILYGAALAAAYWGWKRNHWWLFYAVVVAGSCVKPTYLCLLALPFFSARKQWLPAGISAFAGVFIFAIQSYIWPVEFQHFLQAVDFQLKTTRDYGTSPAAHLAKALQTMQVQHYQTVSTLFLLCYAVPVLAVLWVLSRRYLRGDFTLGQWMPVLLTGTILVNPRTIEYDVAPLTVPFILILSRLCDFFGGRVDARIARWAVFLLFVAINSGAAGNLPQHWRGVECLLCVVLFTGGCWNLMLRSKKNEDILLRS